MFSQEGTFIREFGTRGTGNGQFLKPTHVAADSKGNVYVTDWERRDVQKFKLGVSGYEWVLTFGGKETVAHEQGRFYRKADAYGPNGIAVNSKNQIHVSDSGNCRVQVFDIDGNFLHQIPSAPYTPALALDLSGVRAQKTYFERYIPSACVFDSAGNRNRHPRSRYDLAHSEADRDGIPHDHQACRPSPNEFTSRGETCLEPRWGGWINFPGDPTASLYDPDQKCANPRGAGLLDNATEYVKARLRSDGFNQPGWQDRLGTGRGLFRESDMLGTFRSPTGTWGFPETYIAGVFPAAPGASASAATGPVDVCNNVQVDLDKGITAYDASVNFRGQHTLNWPGRPRSSRPGYPASKWAAPGAIAIGKDDTLFVVDGPAGGYRYPGATRETQNSYKGVGFNNPSTPGYMLIRSHQD